MDQGRPKAAVKLCREALALAGDGSDEIAARARAHAGYLLDWALVVLGRSAEAVHSRESSAVYDRLGDLEEKSRVLNNLGMFAYWAGRWDEAVELYRECGELGTRTGDAETVACSRCNVGEVLSDQGEWDAAQVELAEAYRVWRASGNDGGAGFARMLLGRTAARAGRFAEGIALLEAAVAELAAHGMEDATIARGYLAEALAYAGRYVAARQVLEVAWPGNGAAPGPLLLRVRAVARTAAGEESVRVGLQEALDAARLAGNDYEVGVCLDLLCALPDGPPGSCSTTQRDEVLSRFGVRRLAPAPWSGLSKF